MLTAWPVLRMRASRWPVMHSSPPGFRTQMDVPSLAVSLDTARNPNSPCLVLQTANDLAECYLAVHPALNYALAFVQHRNAGRTTCCAIVRRTNRSKLWTVDFSVVYVLLYMCCCTRQKRSKVRNRNRKLRLPSLLAAPGSS